MTARMRRWAAAGALVVALPLMADSCNDPFDALDFKSVTFFSDSSSRTSDGKVARPLDTETQEGEYVFAAGTPGTVEIRFGTRSGYDECTLDLDGRVTLRPTYLGNSEYVISKHIGSLTPGRQVAGSLRCVDKEGFAVPTISYFSVKSARSGIPVLSPGTIDFGTLVPGALSRTATVTLRNTGQIWFETTRPDADNADVILLTGSGCTVEIVRPGKSCSFKVQLRLATGGPFTGYVGMHVVGAGAEPQPVVIRAFGSGSPPVLGLTPEPVSFGSIDAGTSSEVAVVASNKGTLPLRIESVTWAGSATIAMDAAACIGKTIPPGGECRVLMVFRPTSPGLASGQLTFIGNMVGTPRTLNVSGTGVAVATQPAPEPTYEYPYPPP